MKKENKIIVAIIIAALIIGNFLFFGLYLSKSNQTNSGQTGRVIESDSDFLGNKVVTKVIDGDTVIVEGESVRLLGIDADERSYPCYKAAKERIEELVLSKEVSLEKDEENKDQYERYLRYIFLNNQNINLQLVEEGLAVARFSPENVKYKAEIIEAEKNARENKRGCKWGGSQASQPVNEDYEASLEWEKLTGSATGVCNAGNYYGEEKIVEGRIVDVYKSKTNTVFLNFEKPYPNHCFTAVIFSSDLYKFPENVEGYFKNKVTRVNGIIKEYEGKPEIILNSLEQVEVGD